VLSQSILSGLRSVAFLALFGVLSGSSAFSHATVIRSNPAANTNVQSPREVAIFFSERIQVARSSITVQDESGSRVDNGDSGVDANRRVLRVTLKPLSAGTYNVTWQAQSIARDTLPCAVQDLSW
jgi:methionine-rich copper-binding protein CopC